MKTREVTIKRCISFLLVVVMSIGILSSCGTTKPSNGSLDSDGKTSEVTSGQSEEKPKLTIAIQTYSQITDYEDNYLTQMLEEEMGIDIEFYLLSADAKEAVTQLSLLIASGQKLPDVICTGSLTPEAIQDYGSKGVFLPLNDWLEDEEVATHFNAIASEEDKESMIKASTSPDGNIYSLTIFEPATWNMTPFRLYMNQVWLDKLNLEVPTTTDEYYEVLKAFATQDPNGNGVNDEISVYGITSGTYGENITIPLMNSFVFYPAATINNAVLTLSDDGKNVIAPFVTDEWKAGLEYMNKLCSEGLLPASAFTDDRTQFMAILNNEDVNLVGSLSSGSLSRWNDFDTNKNGQEYEMFGPLEGPAGVKYSPYLEYSPSPIWFVTSSSEYPELAFKLGDLFYREDFSRTVRWGEEGVDWTADEAIISSPEYTNSYVEAGLYDDITLVYLKNIWAENNNKIWRNVNPRYSSVESENTVANGEFLYDDSLKSAYFYADNYRLNFSAHPEHILPKLTYTNEEAEMQAEIIVNVSSYVSQSMAQFITGELPLSKWDNYVSTLEKMGLSDWISNSQAAYERSK